MHIQTTITVTCPSCGHEFPLSEGVRKELSADVTKREQLRDRKLTELRSREEQLHKQAVDLDTEVQNQLIVRLQEAEKRALTKHWAKREKQLSLVVENMASMYGDIQGISGNALQKIEALSLEG